MERLQEEGRSCYKRKDYATALKYFNRAIERGQTVRLFDNRAACHEKLNDFPTALKDAKKAIQLQGEDPTGYLRAGKILIKMEKESVAEEIFRHGLKKVKHVGQGYELLREAHQQLRNKLCPVKSVDPLTVLPREVALLILDHLNFKQHMNACRVSKQWQQFIRSEPNLWQHLDLSDTTRKVRNAFVSRAINVGRKKLTKATLSNLHDGDKALIALIQHCPIEELSLLDLGLQSLNLAETLDLAKNLKRLRLNVHLQSTALVKIVDLCGPRLEALDIFTNTPFVPSLTRIPCLAMKSLRISGDIPFSAHFVMELAIQMPNLRSLTMERSFSRIQNPTPVNFESFTNLSELKVIESGSKINLSKLPISLTKLEVGPHSSQPAFYLPRLQELVISDPDMYPSRLDKYLQLEPRDESDVAGEEILSNLQRLSITLISCELDQLLLLSSHSRLQKLAHIGITECHAWKDEHTEVILDKFKHLRSIDLSETSITGISVKKVVKRGHIQKLVINDCRSVTYDAVDWARQQGMIVEHRLRGESMGGGKRVRY